MSPAGEPDGSIAARSEGPRPPALGALVIGFDASPPSTRAARLALDLARGGRARLWLVFAHQTDPRLAEPRTEEEAGTPVRGATKAMESLVLEAREAHTPADAIVREGDPATVILQVARETDARLILVGTRGLGSTARLLLGSVSARVVSESRVPVTVVP